MELALDPPRHANFCRYYEDEATGKKVLLPFKKVRQQGDGTSIEEIVWNPIGNASEGAMIKFAHPALNESLGVKDIEDLRKLNAKIFDIPFNSKKKYQVHIHCQSADPETDTNDRVLYMKGAPERIFARCSDYCASDGSILPISDDIRKSMDNLQDKMGSNGLRVLGFAMKQLPIDEFGPDYVWSDGREEGNSTPNFPLGEFTFIEKFNAAESCSEPLKDEKGIILQPPHPASAPGLVFLGMMALVDPPREAVPGAVAKCKTAGIKVIMVTGDHPGTAKAIAYKVGILWGPTKEDIIKMNEENRSSPGDADYQDPESAQAIVVPGWEFSDDMGDDKWNAILEHPQIVFARTSPQQKLVIVGNCQRLGHIVAVTGDGVNDSPALKKADIGIAMGIAGTPVTKNAADMILLDDNFASIVAGVEEGRLIFDNLKKSICYTLTSNIPEISPFLCWITMDTPMPLSTVLILAIDLGTDMVPAISMAYEDAEADIMKRPPRNAKVDRLVTRKLIFLAYLQIGIMQAMAGFYAWMVVLNDYGFPPTVLMGNPSGTGMFFGDQTMYCKFRGGQYVDFDGRVDPEGRDPEKQPPTRRYPLWDRGDSGYVEKCTYAQKIFRGRSAQPRASFNFRDADTYDQRTFSLAQPTIESIWALEDKNFFEYSPWRGRMSPFWNNKWVAWNLKRSEERLAGAKAGTLGRKGKADAQFIFMAQPAGVYSVCIANNYDLTGRKRPHKIGAYSSLRDIVNGANGFNLADSERTGAFDGGTCIGELNGKRSYNRARFCNGGYNANGTAKGDPGCGALDSATANIFYCKNGCGLDCSEVFKEDRVGDDVEQCQNVASRLIQTNANQHAQAAYWVSIVVVQWADLLICKTRWLSIRQQGLRNSVLNFGLFFETLLAAWLCYFTPFQVLGTRALRFTHWMPGIPWSMMIFIYDETRKYMMRATSPEVVNQATGQVTRVPGWIERFTYY